MAKMQIKKGDKVVVISGKDKGKEGTVLRVKPEEAKVLVEGVGIVKKSVKPNPQNQQGGIVAQESFIHASKVMLVCPGCGKPSRVGHEQGELDGKRTRIRVCKKCGHKF